MGVLALYTHIPNATHVLRLNNADVLALSKAHALRVNTKKRSFLTATTKEAAVGRLNEEGRPSAALPSVVPLVLAVFNR